MRRAIESWWAVYLVDVLDADRTTGFYAAFAWGLPITATVGSLASGYVSDRLFRGRRAPVAAMLYLTQTLITVIAFFLPHDDTTAGAWLSVLVIISISMMCNSTHSILGTAAAMDLGGRRMAGCAAGIIDSFQYYGALLSGYGLGKLFDVYALPDAADATASSLRPEIWFGSMLPFGLLGTTLMTYLWLKYRRTAAPGT